MFRLVRLYARTDGDPRHRPRFQRRSSCASEDLIQFLDACRQSEPIAEVKQWILDQLRLRAGQSALDVGCGTGDDVAAIAAIVGPNGRAVGVDSSETMVSGAVKRHAGPPGISFELADAAELPFDTSSFDACRAERVLQHVADPDQAVREIARVLRPGGRVALVEPDWDAFLIDGSDPALSGAIWRNTLGGARQPYVGRRLRTLLVENGFLEIEVKGTTAIIDELERAAQIFGFAHAASQAVDAGIVSADRATRWLEDLERAGRDGRFLCVIVAFRAAGTLG